MDSLIDERVLGIMVGVIGASTCDHIVEHGDAFVCYRCSSNQLREGTVLCGECVDAHRAGHEDGECDQCRGPLGDLVGGVSGPLDYGSRYVLVGGDRTLGSVWVSAAICVDCQIDHDVIHLDEAAG